VPAPQLEIDWPAYADEIGRRVKAVREARKVSQIELAGATGISRTQIQNIEQSRTFNKPNAGNTTVYRLFLIAQALGVSPRTFIPDTIPTAEYREVLDMKWPEIEVEVTLETLKHPIPASTVRSIHVQSPVNLYPDEDGGNWVARRSTDKSESESATKEIVGTLPLVRDKTSDSNNDQPKDESTAPAIQAATTASAALNASTAQVASETGDLQGEPPARPLPDWLAHLPRPPRVTRRAY